MHIGVITHKKAALSKLGKSYIKALQKYTGSIWPAALLYVHISSAFRFAIAKSYGKPLFLYILQPLYIVV